MKYLVPKGARLGFVRGILYICGGWRLAVIVYVFLRSLVGIFLCMVGFSSEVGIVRIGLG